MRAKIKEIIVNLKMINEEANDFAIPRGVGDGIDHITIRRLTVSMVIPILLEGRMMFQEWLNP